MCKQAEEEYMNLIEETDADAAAASQHGHDAATPLGDDRA
jgi:hypothetical protein